jgi:hypothetical protein
MTGVRGHHEDCPIARETWCIWDGDKCDYCKAIRKVEGKIWHEAYETIADLHYPFGRYNWQKLALDALREKMEDISGRQTTDSSV